ncbi:MAG: 4Fe-4S binding protein [Caldicoprobacter sp.]|uniref:4Fe-4S binding protein n=1 Tax=Caldicoprobacter sp. TaxID=2004500 RepID=UPI0039C47268
MFDRCTGCGQCVERCPVDAMLSGGCNVARWLPLRSTSARIRSATPIDARVRWRNARPRSQMNGLLNREDVAKALS